LSSRTEKKVELFENWMQGDHVLVHLDSRADGVEVPAHLNGNHALTLKMSYHFQAETTHDETAITSYLRFNNSYEKCLIPWTAIWGLTNAKSENQIWPEDLPKEMLIELARNKLAEVGRNLFRKDKKAKETEQPAAKLKLQKLDQVKVGEDKVETGSGENKKKAPGLKRIK
jgi:hypothetical protein